MNDIKKRFAELQSKLNDLLAIKKEEYLELCSIVNDYSREKLKIAESVGSNFKISELRSSDEYKAYEKKQHQVDMLEKLLKKLDSIFQSPCYVEKEHVKETYKKSINNANQDLLVAKINNYLDSIDEINDMLRESFIVRYRDESIEEELNKVLTFEEEMFGDNTKEQLALYRQRNQKYKEIKNIENELKLLIDENEFKINNVKMINL